MLRTLFAATLLVSAPGADAPAAEPADLVLRNAVVHTGDVAHPRAEAIAVRGSRILAVGSDEDMEPLVGPETRVRDLAGHTVVPGFDDSHAHLLGIGFARLDVNLVGSTTYEEVVERVADAAKTRAPGEWIRDGAGTRRSGRGHPKGQCGASPPTTRSPPSPPTTRWSSPGPTATRFS